MEVAQSIKSLVTDAIKHVEAFVIGPIWGYLHTFYLSGQLWASLYIWVTIFWLVNWLIGTALALVDRVWTPKASAQSLVKLLVYMFALLLASGLKKTHVSGGWFPAGILEAMVAFTTFSYALRSLGRLSKRLGNSRQGEMLSLAADKTDEFMNQRINTRTVVTVTETTTTQPSDGNNETNN